MQSATAWFLAIIVIVFSTGLSARAGETAPNAALKYWQAFAAVQHCELERHDAVLRSFRQVALDAEARALIDCSSDALRLMHAGAALGSCDWGIDFSEGPFAPTRHRLAMQWLAALTGLRARVRFADQQGAAGLDDLVAGLAVARHLSVDGTIASILFGWTIEERMAEELSTRLSTLDGADLARLGTTLQTLLPSGDTSSAMRAQQGGLEWIIREVSLPPPEFQNTFEADMRLLANNPAADQFVPNLPSLRWGDARRLTERALLRAAVAVQYGQPHAIDSHPDPFDGQPFEVERTSRGFILRSRLQVTGTPVSLTVESKAR